MSNKIKIQHYVPRFYLKNFAREDADKFFIECFDKIEEKEFNVNIERVGAEKYFYDTEKDVNQLMEKTLGKFDAKFNSAYTKLISNCNLNVLLPEEKLTIAFFIATQELRTREFREHLKDMVRQVKKRLSAGKISKELERELKEIDTEEGIKDMQIHLMMESIHKFVDIIMEMKWILFINKTNLTLWTSDHPVTRYNSIDFGPYGNLGLLCKGIEIYFPLSPDISLCVCDPVRYSIMPNEFYFTDDQNATFLNHLQVKFCNRHIFSIDGDFTLAKTMIHEHPMLKNPDRKRVDVK